MGAWPVRFSADTFEKRTPCLSWNPSKSLAKHRVVWKSGEADLSKDAGHFAEQIYRDAVGFAQFDTECMHGGHYPLGDN